LADWGKQFHRHEQQTAKWRPFCNILAKIWGLS
jgi:hypothetical protein